MASAVTTVSFNAKQAAVRPPIAGPPQDLPNVLSPPLPTGDNIPEQSAVSPRQGVDARYVHRLHCAIEHCLCHCMCREQTVAVLASRGWPPGVTNVVWSQLATENPAFFASYSHQLAEMHGCAEAVVDSIWATPQSCDYDGGDPSDSDSCSDAESAYCVVPDKF
eukprot:jgi/Tetstr1/443327/TSEL_031342.t1